MVVGRVYFLEFREALALGAGDWTRLPGVGVNGNGGVQRLTDPAAVVPRRYYRVAVE